MGHSSICLPFLPEFENSAEKKTHSLKPNFLEMSHGGEMHWVEGDQRVHREVAGRVKKRNKEETQKCGNRITKTFKSIIFLRRTSE